MPPYEPTHPVTRESEIRDGYPAVYASQKTKFLDHIDPLIAAWIGRTTFLTMATYDAAGRVDVSPKGDPPGFVKVLDRHTLAIPDRPGNHRFDSFANILETGRIGLVFLVPNRNEVVRINGAAQIVRDPDILAQLAIKNRTPAFAVLCHVEEAFFHCGKSIIRSSLWSPDTYPKPDDLPTYAQALLAHAQVDTTATALQAHLKHNDENRLYDE